MIRPGRWLAVLAIAASAAAQEAVPASSGAAPRWLAVDMRGGREAESWPVEWIAAPESGEWDDLHKTGILVLRRIEPGTFGMGSPPEELGRYSNETLHEVTLTRPYCIGVFEVTQRQWELAMGSRTSSAPGETRPADRVGYATVRGASAGAGWPRGGEVDPDSFLGVLRAKTGIAFDLPTEAQWEHACRAGTATALNSGKDLTDAEACSNVAEVGRCPLGVRDGRGGAQQHNTGVGSYRPNAWGLYDMHGNVWEWCLDWYAPYPGGPATDPAGPGDGTERVLRGGSWGYSARHHRSARRHGAPPSYDLYSGYGFRVACPVPPIPDGTAREVRE